MRQIVVDTETTGLTIEEGHRIIEVGCLELINRKLTGRRFHYYINPQREMDAEAFAVHGISNQFLADKPLFANIAEELIEFINGAELLIHNASFDTTFLQHELNLTKKPYPQITTICKITDTLLLARQMHTGQRNSLDALCKRYGIDTSERSLHGALLDAHLLAQVYLAMTGGQSSLFDGLAEDPTPAKDSIQALQFEASKTSRSLPILKASADEVELHQAYLAMIAKKGKCLWLELE